MSVLNYIQNLDASVTKFLNTSLVCPSADNIMIFFTVLGNGLATTLIVAAALYLNRETGGKNFWRNFLWAGAALALAGIAAQAIKWFVNRPRPLTQIKDLRVVWEMLAWRSFPSGHAASAFAAAAFLSAKIKKIAAVFYAVAALVAISRVYIGVHFPTDILAGAALGYFCALLVLKIEEKRGRTSVRV